MCPITKSAKKALRQSSRRRAHNLQKMRKLKNLLKEVKLLISQKKVSEASPHLPPSSASSHSEIEEAKKLLPQVYKLLDKAAKVGLIKKNNAWRKKSRITKLISKSQ